MSKYRFLVVENAPDVCEGIIRRMEPFTNWQSLGYCVGVKEAVSTIEMATPQLIFLDWSLNGGSAYEVLQCIQNCPGYNPYVIFNTGFQKDNPEIPQVIFNNYEIDKYLVKPLWENLRQHLAYYVAEAAAKAERAGTKNKVCWIEDENKNTVAVDLSKLICICQHPEKQRTRSFYLAGNSQPVNISMQWYKCYELLDKYNIPYFIAKNRFHLVTRPYVEKYEKPFIRLKGFSFKVEVVKESSTAFIKWLQSVVPS